MLSNDQRIIFKSRFASRFYRDKLKQFLSVDEICKLDIELAYEQNEAFKKFEKLCEGTLYTTNKG